MLAEIRIQSLLQDCELRIILFKIIHFSIVTEKNQHSSFSAFLYSNFFLIFFFFFLMFSSFSYVFSSFIVFIFPLFLFFFLLFFLLFLFLFFSPVFSLLFIFCLFSLIHILLRDLGKGFHVQVFLSPSQVFISAVGFPFSIE